MTFVGKILVILISLFAMAFLVLSSVVYSTTTNWKTKSAALTTEITKLNGTLNETKAKAEAAEKQREAVEADRKTQTNLLNEELRKVRGEEAAATKEISDNRRALEGAQNNAKAALAEAAEKASETEKLRDILRQVQHQAVDFKDVNRELNDKTAALQRQLDVAVTANKKLREERKALQALLKTNNLPSDVSQVKALASPPDVEGEVKKVDARNHRVEITIGSDDGLVVGHELSIFHTQPTPEYIGKIRIESVEPDQAVGVVVGKTVQGKKIVEGDRVTTQIRSRSN